MFNAQLVPRPLDRETEVQVVMIMSMVPSRSGDEHIQLDGNNLAVNESTHISEHDGLSPGGKRATLCQGEPCTRTADPDLERFLPMAIITD
jgi:hypothetical protein